MHDEARHAVTPQGDESMCAAWVDFLGSIPAIEGESMTKEREREREIEGSKWRVMSRVCYTHIMPGPGCVNPPPPPPLSLSLCLFSIPPLVP